MKEDAEKILSQISQNNQLSTDGAYYVAKLLVDRGEKDRARKILENMNVSVMGPADVRAKLKLTKHS